MNAITEIAVDLLRPGMPVIVHAKQNDSATRYIYATLTQNGAPYEIPAGTIGTMRVRKPDGTACFYDSTETAQAVSISGNVAQCLLVDQALTAAGKAECEVNLYNSEGEKLTSFTFALFIQASVLDDAEIVSSSYYNVLTQKIAEAQQAASAAASSANAAASSAQEAEQSAQDAAASVVDAVKSVNGETPNASGAVTVGGADIQLTGYSMPSSTSPIAAADSVNAGLGKLEAALTPKIDRGQLLDLVYPVGSIYIAYHHTSPAELFGGTWTRMQDCFLWACAASESIGETGGEKTHVLTVNEMPSHRHDVDYAGTSGNSYGFVDSTSAGSSGMQRTSYTGGGAAHNNMPPYVSVAVWRRTA